MKNHSNFERERKERKRTFFRHSLHRKFFSVSVIIFSSAPSSYPYRHSYYFFFFPSPQVLPVKWKGAEDMWEQNGSSSPSSIHSVPILRSIYSWNLLDLQQMPEQQNSGVTTTLFLASKSKQGSSPFMTPKVLYSPHTYVANTHEHVYQVFPNYVPRGDSAGSLNQRPSSIFYRSMLSISSLFTALRQQSKGQPDLLV